MRNKEKTREFLKMWADLEHDAPMGFHSSDNGAIHVAFTVRKDPLNDLGALMFLKNVLKFGLKNSEE